jgi:hypothetical protein
MSQRQPIYLVILKAVPSDIPAVARLTRMLKITLRACQLRCLRIEEVRSHPASNDRSPDAADPK